MIFLAECLSVISIGDHVIVEAVELLELGQLALSLELSEFVAPATDIFRTRNPPLARLQSA